MASVFAVTEGVRALTISVRIRQMFPVESLTNRMDKI